MPKGIPVPTLAIGEAGAGNAGLSVAAMLAVYDPEMRKKLVDFRAKQAKKVAESKLPEL
jgi:5-(carboxyamino)imidazole ribonucleotide mutase